MTQSAELYIVALIISEGSAPKLTSYVGKGRGLSVQKDTANCVYVSEPPRGLPERYRKTEEYKLQNNQYALYMYGTDSDRLILEWNSAASLQMK